MGATRPIHKLIAEEKRMLTVPDEWPKTRHLRHVLLHGTQLTVEDAQARFGVSSSTLPITVHDLELTGFTVERVRGDNGKMTYRVTNPEHEATPLTGPRYQKAKNAENGRVQTNGTPAKTAVAMAADYPPLGRTLRVVMVAETPDDVTTYAVVLADEWGRKWFAHVDQDRSTGATG